MSDFLDGNCGEKELEVLFEAVCEIEKGKSFYGQVLRAKRRLPGRLRVCIRREIIQLGKELGADLLSYPRE